METSTNTIGRNNRKFYIIMCGIFLYLSKKQIHENFIDQIVNKGISKMQHRGPDNKNIKIS